MNSVMRVGQRPLGLRGWRFSVRQAAGCARVFVALVVCTSANAQAPAGSFTAATWNLGWHLSEAESLDWAARCGQRFARNPRNQQWAPNPDGERTGWELTWGRHAPIQWAIGEWPPCDVYQDRFKPVPVTAQSYAVRQRQLREVLAERVKADLIAFQEVSGEASVREVLPDGGRGWEICSYTGYKVQRLAIAWRQTLGRAVACEVQRSLSLPSRPLAQQPRPGLALTLEMNTPQGTKRLRVLTLHLKSSCVSPIEAATQRQSERGQLDGEDEHCQILHDQVAPLEAWIEQASRGVDGVLLLGDFNRNLAHEAREAANAPVRRRGLATDAHGPGTRVRNLWRDVNDGQPRESTLRLLDAQCSDLAVAALCDAAKARALNEDETRQLRSAQAGLGCRNPIGLDHMALGGALVPADGPRKVALGLYGRTRGIRDGSPNPLLAVSDHCPLVATIGWR